MTTVIVITLAKRNHYNTSLIEHIKNTSSHDVVLAWDAKHIDKDFVENKYNFINSYETLKQIYGEKINNFNGRWMDNPAKLGVLHWFSNTQYDKMWVFEDDVYVKNCSTFVNSYNHIDTDVICKHSTTLPFWFPNYRVGDSNTISQAKDFIFASSLYCTLFQKSVYLYFT